jgi:hypothetical protein
MWAMRAVSPPKDTEHGNCPLLMNRICGMGGRMTTHKEIEMIPKIRVKTWQWVWAFEPQFGLGIVTGETYFHIALGPLVLGWEKK